MASTEWFYGSPENKLGPVDQLTLVAMAHQHTINPKTLVWSAAMPKWVPAGSLPFLYAPQRPGADPGLNLLLPIGPQSGFAIAAGYLGLFSFFPILAPLAIIFGVLALRDLKAHPEKRGMGRAVTGITLGTVAIIVIVLIVALRR
ncbi:MAG: GYF domain-containing protein [Kofleriaceae bacterium]